VREGSDKMDLEVGKKGPTGITQEVLGLLDGEMTKASMGCQVTCQHNHFKHNSRQFYPVHSSRSYSVDKVLISSCLQQNSILALKAANSSLQATVKEQREELNIVIQRSREY
jgi:hypothetical protein